MLPLVGFWVPFVALHSLSYWSITWAAAGKEDQAHSSFVLAALDSTRTSVQIAAWKLSWMAKQQSSLYCRGPVTLLTKLDRFKLA